jgi:hypothetical protein
MALEIFCGPAVEKESLPYITSFCALLQDFPKLKSVNTH